MKIPGLSAIVTGGASGLGAATATMLSAAGATVTIFDTDQDRGRVVASQINGKFVCVDVSHEQQVIAGFNVAEAQTGMARILINCAGIAPALETVGRGSPYRLDAARRVIEVNQIGTIATVAHFAHRLSTQGRDRSDAGIWLRQLGPLAVVNKRAQPARKRTARRCVRRSHSQGPRRPGLPRQQSLHRHEPILDPLPCIAAHRPASLKSDG